MVISLNYKKIHVVFFKYVIFGQLIVETIEFRNIRGQILLKLGVIP